MIIYGVFIGLPFRRCPHDATSTWTSVTIWKCDCPLTCICIQKNMCMCAYAPRGLFTYVHYSFVERFVPWCGFLHVYTPKCGCTRLPACYKQECIVWTAICTNAGRVSFEIILNIFMRTRPCVHRWAHTCVRGERRIFHGWIHIFDE